MSEEEYNSVGINLQRDLVALTLRVQDIEDKIADLQKQIDDIKAFIGMS